MSRIPTLPDEDALRINMLANRVLELLRPAHSAVPFIVPMRRAASYLWLITSDEPSDRAQAEQYRTSTVEATAADADAYGIRYVTAYPLGTEAPLFCAHDPEGTGAAAHPHIASGICNEQANIRIDTRDYTSEFFCSAPHARTWLDFLIIERCPFRVVPVGPNGVELDAMGRPV